MTALWSFLAMFAPAPTSRVVYTGLDPRVRGNLLVTLEYTPHRVAMNAGARVYTRTYSGQFTVWRSVATGRRVNRFTEARLADVYAMWARTVGAPHA
jgi:hypothetical protein